MLNTSHKSLVVLFVLSIIALGISAGTVGAAGDTEISITANETNVSVGTTQTFDVVVENTPDDIQGFEFLVELSNNDTAEITNVSPEFDTALSIFNTTHHDKNSSVTVEAFKPSLTRVFQSDSPTIVTVTIQAKAPGETELNVTGFNGDIRLADSSANPYTVTKVNAASITSEKPGVPTLPDSLGPVQNADSDNRFEDTNGDGSFTPADVTHLFLKRNSAAVQDNAALFDYNEDGSFNPADVTSLFKEILS